MSGTGKSSALAELARRGFRTVETDEPGWTVEDAASLPLAEVVDRLVEIAAS
jgi:predicted ATPase